MHLSLILLIFKIFIYYKYFANKSKNEIGESGCILLCKSLSNMTRLKKLSLELR